MRPSLKRHALVILRERLSMTQADLADRVGCSFPTIRGIEAAQFKLSEKLAKKISDKTGVGVGWLLRGDPTIPPVDNNGQAYSRETLEEVEVIENIVRAQPSALSRAVRPVSPEQYVGWAMQRHGRQLLSILLSAYEHGDHHLCSHKMGEALFNLEKQFGLNPQVGPTPLSKSGKMYLGNWVNDLEEAIGICKRRLLKAKRKTKPKKTGKGTEIPPIIYQDLRK